jgi:hypothetical protein
MLTVSMQLVDQGRKAIRIHAAFGNRESEGEKALSRGAVGMGSYPPLR